MDTLFEVAKSGGFAKNILFNCMEKKKTSYQNSNAEADKRAHNNRLLFLVPHMYHDAILAKVLGEEIEKLDKTDDDTLTDFDPGKFLKERILE